MDSYTWGIRDSGIPSLVARKLRRKRRLTDSPGFILNSEKPCLLIIVQPFEFKRKGDPFNGQRLRTKCLRHTGRTFLIGFYRLKYNTIEEKNLYLKP